MDNYGLGHYDFDDHFEDTECNICYEIPCDLSNIIILTCCNNSKKICISCLQYLTTPMCPYCRTKLPNSCIPYLNQNNILCSSDPFPSITWETFVEQENSINPYLYEDSRRLRRQMRRLRYEYNQRVSNHRNSINIPNISTNNRRNRTNRNRNQRQLLRSYSRDMERLYQNNPQDDLFHLEI